MSFLYSQQQSSAPQQPSTWAQAAGKGLNLRPTTGGPLGPVPQGPGSSPGAGGPPGGNGGPRGAVGGMARQCTVQPTGQRINPPQSNHEVERTVASNENWGKPGMVRQDTSWEIDDSETEDEKSNRQHTDGTSVWHHHSASGNLYSFLPRVGGNLITILFLVSFWVYSVFRCAIAPL